MNATMTMKTAGATQALPDAAPEPAIDELRWEAVCRRDAAEDGRFYFGVRTTGVYCRPSCGARRPLRSNVGFFTTRDEAQAAGLRPCRRCRPELDGPAQGRIVAEACRTIEDAAEPPALAELAKAAGLSASRFHRVFKALTGVTPKAYGEACRARRVQAGLQDGRSVTTALFDAGYGASSRFYARADKFLGMAPGAYRRGGDGATIRFAVAQCSLGPVLVAATDIGVCAIRFGDDADRLVCELQDSFPQARLEGGNDAFEALVARVLGAIERPSQTADLPLDIKGTVFQERVWQALRDIPLGQTASYAEVARRVGLPRASRAVAAACAANPVAVAIPCHRVVRTDGALSGYRWGVARKRSLLEREGAL